MKSIRICSPFLGHGKRKTEVQQELTDQITPIEPQYSTTENNVSSFLFVDFVTRSKITV